MAEIQFNGTEWEIKDALQAFYTPYASYVIQTRALPDARDGLKTGARYILYAQYKDKLTYKEKRRKAVATINAAMRFSPHGDSSILGTAVRMSQDFSLRYPIIEVQGNNGSIISGDDYSQSRYLEMRGNEIAWEMTQLLPKNTIDEWKMNYTNEEEYPTVLPTKFPYGLVNGSFGIGVACASSLPPHNLNDVCKALITLLYNPNVSFEDIYCPIDFPTGGIIINEDDVKESLKNGTGRAAIIRATIDYDEKANELKVKEIPYMTFTSSITKSITKALEEGKLVGISGIIDETDFDGCKISIQLNKGVNVERILKSLYKYTALQSSYSINMNMLENGKVPKLFTWKEALDAYLWHLRTILIKAYQFDLDKLEKRIHILEGLIIAFQNLDEVIEIIKTSKDDKEASTRLIASFSLTETQTKAILDMKLSRLTSLEISKLKKELNEKTIEANRIKNILSHEDSIKKEMTNEINQIKEKYGDERRTKNITLNFSSKDDDAEPIEEKQLLIYYTNLGNIYTQESSTLLRARRGTKGSKIKLANNECVENIITDSNLGSLLVFSNKGLMYQIATDELPIGTKVNISQLFEFQKDEHPTAITTLSDKTVQYFIFITKDGMIKKTSSKEYLSRRTKSIKAINLKDNDEVISVLFTNDSRAGILTHNGNFVIIETSELSAIGRATAGVKAIKLSLDDYVIDAKEIKTTDKYLVALSKNGLIKKTSLSEFPVCNRGIKGKKISDTKENDSILKFLTFSEDCDIIIVSEKKVIKIATSELRELSRGAAGVKSINLDEKDFARDLKKVIE